jgi:hypothetical protein
MKIHILLASAALASAVPAADPTFTIDATRPGRALPNVQQTLVVWHLDRNSFGPTKRNREHDVLEFAEYVEVMGATGGNPQRDCLRNPADRSVLDDYDFSRLVEGCKGIVGMGLKPYLKLGNVPQKFSTDNNPGSFRMNIRPPDDYAAYGRYMTACAKALLDAFGREELLKWRFAVLTEFENGGWFKDASGDAEKTFHAYCRLYETTVDAFTRTISPDLTFGVHAMAVIEGLWDERKFIRYAAERKLPLRFVTASFYDDYPGKFTTGHPLPRNIARLREAAESAGLTNLFYAVDEGRLLYGKTRKKKGDHLTLRIVGDTYQAAYDARIVKQLFDSGAEYFAAWGYLSGPNTHFDGLPSVSFHVARESARFKGMRRLPVSKAGCAAPGVEADAVAALSPDGSTMRIMAYAFTNDLFATGTTRIGISVVPPPAWKGRKGRVTRCVVDDDANWFDEWRAERKRLNIGDERFSWSPDDPSPACSPGLSSAKDREFFRKEIEPRLRPCAQLKHTTAPLITAADGSISLFSELPANAVLFVELQQAN